MTTRPATRSDQQALLALWQAFLEEQTELDGRFAAAEDAAVRWRNDFPVWLTDSTRYLHVAEAEDGSLAGFILAHLTAPPPIYAHVPEVYVDEIYIAPPQRGHGAGGALVAAVQRWASEAGARRLRIGALAANEAGRAFWERHGASVFSVTLTLDVPAPERPARPSPRMGFTP